MKNEIYYFTGTGNSLHISKELGELIGDAKLISISNLQDKDVIESQADTFGIVFPIYCWNLPNIVVEFIKKLKVSSNTYVYAVCNCGASYGGALKITKDLLAEKNINLSSAFTIIMPDNSIAFPTKEKDIPVFLNNMPGKVKEVAEIVSKREQRNIDGHKIASKTIGNTMGFVCNNILGFSTMKVDDNSCIQCGLCEQVCPVDNISAVDGLPRFGNKCEMCFACIHYCPKQSITYKRQKSLNNYQYVNPEITIEEIKNR